jgi:hypothetical protein
MVDEAGVTPLPKHVAAVQDCPPPYRTARRRQTSNNFSGFLVSSIFTGVSSQQWPALSSLSQIS